MKFINKQLIKKVLFIIGAILALYASFMFGAMTAELKMLRGNKLGGGGTAQPNVQAPSQLAEAPGVDPVSDSDHIRGNPNAKIALIEYSDYECPYCKSFHPTAKQVVEAYGDDVMWVYRHFPLESIHPRARPSAIAAECVAKAGGNDAFWAYTDALFAGSDLSDSNLLAQANNLGFDISTCYENGETNDLVDAGLESGTRAGITGTPGNVIINRETDQTLLIPGALPFAEVSRAIDNIL